MVYTFPAVETGLPADVTVNTLPTWMIQWDPWACDHKSHGGGHSHDRAACMSGHVATFYEGVL